MTMITIPTVNGIDGSVLTIKDDVICIDTNGHIKRIPLSEVRSIRIENDERGSFVSIKSDRLIIWGDRVLDFYFPMSELNAAKDFVGFANDFIHGIDCDMQLDTKQHYSLNGLKGTTLFADCSTVVITGKIKKHTISVEDINTISLVDDGSSIPHISITKRATYVKGDNEYDFYYTDDLEKAEEVVMFIKKCIKSSAVG